MGFFSKFIARIVFNAVALYAATQYFPATFALMGGLSTIAIGAVVLALLYSFIRPFLTAIATPLLWITVGLFNIVINMLLLWVADAVLTQVAVHDIATLFWVSLIVAVANSFF